jgi:hypothetical protein
MPGYKGHLIGGAVAFCITLVIVSYFYQCQPTPIALAEWLGFCLAGSLFPDIDTKSKGQKYFYRGVLLALIFLAYKKQFDILAWVCIVSITPMLVKHRGLFHRIWFLIGMPLLLWYMICIEFPCYRAQLFFDVIFFIAGSLSHVWLDVGLRRMLRF